MFGKRKVRPGAPLSEPGTSPFTRTAPDADGVFRAIPKDMWEGEHGAMLRELGFQPDDPSNMLPQNPGLLEARADQAHEAQKRFMAEINESLQGQLPGVTVVPWAMIPWSVWEGRVALFLTISCKMFPAEPWNMFLMPADDRSAEALGWQVHPYREIPGLMETCTRLLLELADEHQAVFEATGRRLEAGDVSALESYQHSSQSARANVIKLARYLAADLFGQQSFDRHRAVFGKNLGWD